MGFLPNWSADFLIFFGKFCILKIYNRNKIGSNIEDLTHLTDAEFAEALRLLAAELDARPDRPVNNDFVAAILVEAAQRLEKQK
ncbi:hypothetical protein [uncultured Mediterranean phage uvMED]|nr:hypothetical protein [uncultured Mediterranean phage uvMED]